MCVGVFWGGGDWQAKVWEGPPLISIENGGPRIEILPTSFHMLVKVRNTTVPLMPEHSSKAQDTQGQATVLRLKL